MKNTRCITGGDLLSSVSFKEYKCTIHGYGRDKSCDECNKKASEYQEDEKTGYWLKYGMQ